MSDEGPVPGMSVEALSPAWIPLADGARLGARIWRPVGASEGSPVPALLEAIPYRTRDLTALRDEGLHGAFAAVGYASVRVDLRGTGDSTGLIGDEYTAQEQADCCEVIAWLAAQPWCTGRVGMFGNSWGGFNALQVAALRPAALRAIITSCSTDDRFGDDMHYRGGALLTDMLDWGATFLCWMSLPPDPAVTGETWRARWLERIEDAAARPALVEWLRHPTRDAYWRHGSVIEDPGAIECPVLAVGGWRDGYSNAIPRLLAGLDATSMGVVGPWAHGYPHAAPPGPDIDFLGLATRWWDRWLRGVGNGCEDEPSYRVFVAEGVPPDPGLRIVPGGWVAEADWPSPRISWRERTLGDGGPRRVDTAQTVGEAAGEWCPYGTGGDGPELPGDQAPDDARSVCFDAPPLDEAVAILGGPTLELDLELEGSPTLAVARVCDVWPDGRSTLVSSAVLLVRPERVGRERVHLVLDDTAYRFLPGHTIRIALSSTWWPMVWPPTRRVWFTVHPATSTLRLPVRPNDPVDADPVALGEPWRPPVEADRLSAATVARITTPTPDGGLETVNEMDSGLVRVRSTGVTYRSAARDTATIHDDDPLTARMASHREVELVFVDGIRVLVAADAELTGDADRLVVTGRIRATEDGREVADRAFEARLPRAY